MCDMKSIGWTPKKVTATKEEIITVNSGPGTVARLYVETEGVEVSLLNGTKQVWPTLTGGSNDTNEFYDAPLNCDINISLSFGGAGTAYVLYR